MQLKAKDPMKTKVAAEDGLTGRDCFVLLVETASCIVLIFSVWWASFLQKSWRLQWEPHRGEVNGKLFLKCCVTTSCNPKPRFLSHNLLGYNKGPKLSHVSRNGRNTQYLVLWCSVSPSHSCLHFWHAIPQTSPLSSIWKWWSILQITSASVLH